ncbi:MAG: hypothetical protein IKB83_02570 [Mycoplasmataceae bacterium]|nr:hypothetical protein [Mycoplasmataceae bacterium]
MKRKSIFIPSLLPIPLLTISLLPITTISCSDDTSSVRSELKAAFDSFNLEPRRTDISISIETIKDEATLNQYFQLTGTMPGFEYKYQIQYLDKTNNQLLVAYKISMIEKNREVSKLIKLTDFKPIEK